MKEILLDDIKPKRTSEELFNMSKFAEREGWKQRFLQLAEEAIEIARPKAIYKVAFIDEIDDEEVQIEGIKFESRILSENLKDVGRVFPFVATCGCELEDWAGNFDNMMDDYLTDDIKEIFLADAREKLEKHIKNNFNPGAMSRMNPGSLEDWPIAQQKSLFDLLGNVYKKIGVELTDSMLMKPNKSVSGIFFADEKDYNNCRLCARENCPNREDKFDPEAREKQL
ncbi:vitamin B12 dependent-methionine synthase activation domain-containing protein [Halarsenatibacter silvermanii]|uniref:Vitamin B12 dependent methionine synthase, activation domain n=1 Tax=Halarsenatibacter silvermanii TaxID=321763 RepID=A0A1G9IYL5_9FIRM|nr:vitamin B12 dependent-methionine synthase activation domain-containing protein [Halarsenatibacter silvermanii]SDL30192.1 Vitamin B12 dependent methionine synthase, activation domain [Halarsenatibacter silvermanii]